MVKFALTLTPHPATAKDHKGDVIVDIYGNPVSLLPNQRAIRWDSRIIGYVAMTPRGHKISVILEPRFRPVGFDNAVAEFVAENLDTALCGTSAVGDLPDDDDLDEMED